MTFSGNSVLLELDVNILALSSENQVKSTGYKLFDSFGHLYKNPNFEFDLGLNAEAVDLNQNCGLVWKNQIYIFGGEKLNRQILKVDNCKIKNTGKQLPMDTSYPACVNTEDEIWICFVSNDSEVNGSSFF